MSAWLLVHPPLLGPAGLQPLAAELLAAVAEGQELPANAHDVAVPAPGEWPDDPGRVAHLLG